MPSSDILAHPCQIRVTLTTPILPCPSAQQTTSWSQLLTSLSPGDTDATARYDPPCLAAAIALKLNKPTTMTITRPSSSTAKSARPPSLVVDHESAAHDRWYTAPAIKLWFGVGVEMGTSSSTRARRIWWGPVRRALTESTADEISLARYWAVEKECDVVKLNLLVFPCHEKYDYVLALYNNYSKEEGELEEHYEKEMLKILWDALDVPAYEPAKWWFEQ